MSNKCTFVYYRGKCCMVGLMKYCISILCMYFLLYENHRKKLGKMPIIETDVRLYEQTSRHVFMEEDGVSNQMGEYSMLSGIDKESCCVSMFISAGYQCAMHTLLFLAYKRQHESLNTTHCHLCCLLLSSPWIHACWFFCLCWVWARLKGYSKCWNS